MGFQATCDNWLDELKDVSGLEDATTHRYASWSPAAMADTTPGRHLAVWPSGDLEIAAAMIAGTPPSDLSTQLYSIAVWEGAVTEATRVVDDDAANAAWIALYEAVRDRVYILANMTGPTALGGAGTSARFLRGEMDMKGAARYMALNFQVQVPLSYT